jgi:hypothetical protein
MQRLAETCAGSSHEFWPDDVSLLDPRVAYNSRIHGPRQITDVYLLALAVRHGGQFVRSTPEFRARRPSAQKDDTCWFCDSSARPGSAQGQDRRGGGLRGRRGKIPPFKWVDMIVDLSQRQRQQIFVRSHDRDHAVLAWAFAKFGDVKQNTKNSKQRA